MDQETNRLLSNVMGKPQPVIVRGDGIYLYDDQGREYIDAAGGAIVVNLGHGLVELAEVLKNQAEKVAYTLRHQFSNEPAQALAAKLHTATGGALSRTFFVSGGSEANEVAVKLARKYHIDNDNPSKHKVISRWQSYHGGTMGALSWSGYTDRRRDYVPLFRDFSHVAPAYCYRCWFRQTPESCDLACADALENEILCQGPETVAAFIAEPVVGAALAAAVPREGYFKRIREICDRHDVLLIFDEIMTGFGRTGRLFAYEHFGVVPDIMTAGKGMSGGYFPLGGVLATDRVTDTIAAKSGAFMGGYTYSGNPLGCAVGNKAVDYLQEHQLVDRSAALGSLLFDRLQDLRNHPTVGDIRGLGLMIGVEFVKDKATKQTIDKSLRFSRQLFEEALSQGITVLASDGCDRGQAGDMILLGPPFVITEAQIDEVVERLDRVISVVEKRNGLGATG
jgi:adenosylmethionine-8-amino-7-oxononanoate aminotransferase